MTESVKRTAERDGDYLFSSVNGRRETVNGLYKLKNSFVYRLPISPPARFTLHASRPLEILRRLPEADSSE